VHDSYSKLCLVDPFLFTIGTYWQICNFKASHQSHLYICLPCPIFISCCWLLSQFLFLLLSFLPPFYVPGLCSLPWSRFYERESESKLLPTPRAQAWECMPCLCCSGAVRNNVRSEVVFVNLPVLLKIEHLSIDKALLWDDSNQRENTKQKVQSLNEQCGTW